MKGCEYMAIVLPEQMVFDNQRFSAIIYGPPGAGKTTLALSAPSPVLIDFDNGISRVRADHRKPTSVCATYEEVLRDITPENMKPFETIVIDTGGAFVTFLKDWAMRTKPGAKTKAGDFNSLKGFGFVKNEFTRFTEYVKLTLQKNIIFVFHTEEKADKDGNPTQRLLCEGSAKNTVWNPCDFGGFVQIINGQRYVCFSPQAEYFAKGTHGIHGNRLVADLSDPKTPNVFFTKLFEEARKNIQQESDACAPQREKYENVMAEARAICDALQDADDVNEAVEDVKNMEHALTSQKESAALINAKAKALNLVWSKVDGKYVEKVDK